MLANSVDLIPNTLAPRSRFDQAKFDELAVDGLVPKEVALRESIRYQVPWYDRATDAPTTPDALASDTTDTKAAAEPRTKVGLYVCSKSSNGFFLISNVVTCAC